MARGPFARLHRWLTAPDRPLAAIEVRPESVGCLRLLHEGGRLRLGTAALLELPPGAVEVSATEPNVRQPEVFQRVLARVTEQAGLAAGARVALVVPDPAGRAVLLKDDLESAGGATLEELVRFRLKKMMPFDVRTAAVAAVRVPGDARGAAGVLAAVMARPVLESWEAPVLALGLRPGHVELSGLALARLAAGVEGDRLLVNLEPGYLTLVLSRAGRPLLVRTLSAGGSDGLGAVAREITQTLLYHRDRLGGDGLSGAGLRPTGEDTAAVADRLEEALGVRPEPLTPWTVLGAQIPEARSGGLAGAAACLLAGEIRAERAA